MPESLFQRNDSKKQPQPQVELVIPVENLEPSAYSPELVAAQEHLASIRRAFTDNYQAVAGQLPPGEAVRFSCVRDLPDLFEQKIRAYAGLPESRKYAIDNPQTVAYLKSYLLNYNVRDSGPVFHAMESVLRENAVAASGSVIDIAFHHFFKTAPGELIEAIAKLIAVEQRLDSGAKGV